MQLNIKNPEAYQVVNDLAALLNMNKSEAVLYATKKCLAEEKQKNSKKGLADRLMKLGAECAPHIKEPWKSTPHGDLLYDELGLPK